MVDYPTQREYLKVLFEYGSYLAKKIDEGNMFRIFRDVVVPQGGSYSLVLDNSSNTRDIIVSYVDVESEGRVDVFLLKDVSITDLGTEIIPDSFIIGDNFESPVKVYENATYSGGTKIDGGMVQSYTGGKAIGGDESIMVVSKIRAGDVGVIEVDNVDNADRRVMIKIVYHVV